MSELKKIIHVTDTSTEGSVRLNNILTALVLMVMSWVGWNIQEMRKDITNSQVKVAVLQTGLSAVQRNLDRQIYNWRELYRKAEKTRN